tara:strand:+ start:599 stop:982 length:384 start_codon:yes stop_codon:yes gene_type:complete
MVERRSLEEIEGRIWPEAVKDAPAIVGSFHEARRTPVNLLTDSQLLLLFEQGQGLGHLLDTVIERLDARPMVAGGELLQQVLDYSGSKHGATAHQIERLRRIATCVQGVDDDSSLGLTVWAFLDEHA